MKIKRYAVFVTPKQPMSLWAIIIIWSCLLQPTYLKTDVREPTEQQHQRTHHHQRSEATSLHATANYITLNKYKFRHKLYNATIPENSVGKTYAIPLAHEDIMGIAIIPGAEVKYRIVAGDRDKLFKAEERLVDDIAFLAIRTRTSNVVLNREKNEEYLLKVRAMIKYNLGDDYMGDETETTVHIRVLDRNDLSPLFYPIEYAQIVPEDMPIHRSILRVTAEDADLGINGEIYYSFLIDNEYFSIHPTTGVITLNRQLRYTDSSHYNLTVLANDRGSAINHYNHQSSKAKVSITVEQVNLHTPEIYFKTFSSITSNFSSNIYGIVKVSDNDTGKHGEINKLQIVDGDPDGNFVITPTHNIGEYFIEINKFAKLNDSIKYNLTLRAEDKGVPMRHCYKTIPVHFIKERNNAPVFTKHLYEISIPETSPPNMPVIRLKVTDPDLGKNAMVYLEIVGGNEGGEFRINPDSGMLYTQKPLDAESKSFYTLTVSAIDQANLGFRKQSSAKVKVNIQDMNDNDPLFEPMNTTIELDENELAGAFVVKLTARDRDSGENAYISYSIANLNEVPFEIDHFTGELKTTTLIDYETMRRTYVLSVRASDWGLPYRRQTELELLIKIRDINDNRPQFERVNCFGKVLRNIPVGTEIFTLSAIDFDAGDFITYRLISGNEDGCFNLDPTTGVLSIGCDLADVSTATTRYINVSSTDGTHFSDEMNMVIDIVGDEKNVYMEHIDMFSGYGSFECRETGVSRRLAENLAAAERNNANVHEKTYINDLGLTPSRYGENMHAPEFIDFPHELRLNESIELGETVMWIKARDRDLGYNGKLVFAISDGDNDSVFRIDPDSGELQIIGYLDRERQDEYVLNVTVYDLGQPQKSQSKFLPVFILDSNDNRPVFQKSLATFHLPENAFNGTLIFCLNASDADIEENAKITYLKQTETRDFFVNISTGCIYLANALDREKLDKYELHIIAKDNGEPALTAEAVINILVEDINDNAPIFGVQEFIFKVREDIPRGTVVAAIEATDIDIGPNGEIFFSIKEELATEELFKIDKHTGVIRTLGYLDYEKRQVHNLIVSAIDRGSPSLTTDMPVVIEIIDVNENRFAPEFGDFVYTGKVKENLPSRSFVMNITAKDADINGPDSKISYSIRGGDGLGVFTVNDEGIIRTLSHLDAETKSSYWLTLCAQDHAIIPLSSCVQVNIQVEDENDNVPLTDKPVYYVSVLEGSPENTPVIQLNAYDNDKNPAQFFTYRIISGNPEGFFELNSTTGDLITTERKLDRENQAEHILEISISDNGTPALTSTTRVVVSVEDINDHSPEFEQRFYKIQVPSTVDINETVFQARAIDNDIGENGRITYFIKSGKGKNRFRMDPDTGFIYLMKPLEVDAEYDLNIRAEDNGTPKRSQNAKLNIVVIPISTNSPHAPVIKADDSRIDVTESDRPGFLVALVQATDEDNDHLWYNLSDGNERNEFYIGKDNGHILLSKSLDRETQSSYNLTVTVTDGTHIVNTNLYIHVVDINDNRPQFTQDIYYVNISENIEEEAIIMQLHATDKDEDNKIFYTLHAAQDPTSLSLFRVDSISGNVLVIKRLDYEKNRHHTLIVIAKDQGTPAKRNYAKIVITVHDHNDHHPEFMSKIVQSKVPESAAIGSKVAELTALDLDSGKNAEIKYSIITGNVGNTFEIEPTMGIVTLSKSLNINKMQEYMLQIKATDHGEPPLSSQVPLHIIVTMSENDPPIFMAPLNVIEIYENIMVGTFVCQVEARSSSSVFYEVADGDVGQRFRINPSTGVITANDNIDYEKNKSFNLTIIATNMASATSTHNIIIHILDINDNEPFFEKTAYNGTISEIATIGSFVFQKNDPQKRPLLVTVKDLDEGVNSMIEYTILNNQAKEYFEIDSSTGAIKLLKQVDYERNKYFRFDVMINDLGVPKLYAKYHSTIHIDVENINDCPPVFTKSYMNVTLYQPTYENIIIAEVNATDADLDENTKIRYDIIDGNADGCFEIDATTGIVTTRDITHLDTFYTLHIRASDGLYSAIAQIDINIETLSTPGFVFQKPFYTFSTIENSSKIVTVGLVNVVGNLLHENVEFSILSPTKMFVIGKTSGAIKTTGLPFDRENQDIYTIVIEARSLLLYEKFKQMRRAIVRVDISILDVNDNCPIFVNLPYYATLSVDDVKGTIITSVKAVDLDSYENGEVRYEMKKGNGELFKVDRKSGELVLKQIIDGSIRVYDLIIAAYDGAISPCSTDAAVNIKVVDRSMPTFDKQFYSDVVKENAELFSALSIAIQAESPLKRRLIYTISSGNEDEVFEIDYRTGVIYIVNELDYETKQSHEFLVRATDSLSGIYAEVTVSIIVEDANDCYPTIEQDNYNISISENLLIGSQIMKVNASDCDANANSELSYFIDSVDGKNNSALFYIDMAEGYLYLKSNLDAEESTFHHIILIVKDHGTPSLSSRANVWLTVKDLNDNFPKFTEASFSCRLSVNAQRGQFVINAKAYDPDHEDNEKLKYRIIDGNELQTYTINENNGVITLQNMQNFTDHHQTLLNVSVSDGVHTTFARVKIILMPENNHAPKFMKSVYEASVKENEAAGKSIVLLQAYDADFGRFAKLTYDLVSEEFKEYFEIDNTNGSITTKVAFDREQRAFYDVLVRVSDEGGKADFTTLKIKVVDVNDNSPRFMVKEYKLVVKVNTTINTTLLKVKAFDMDENENSQISYTIDESTVSETYKDIFTINEADGSLSLMKPVTEFANNVAQFFVRAMDGGSPQFHNDVPVTIQFINADVTVPEFEKNAFELHVLESTPPGSVLTKLRISGNYSVKFSIPIESRKFSISENGEVILMQTLDREVNDVHYIIVMAETETIPPLFAVCEIYIHVLDENDNSPKFDSREYNVNIGENIDKVASIIKVTATDMDMGSNGDIRYYLEDETNTASNVFDIDIYSGWITLLSTLDRETQSEYHFNVLATDNGQPKHVSKVPVSIKIIDYNDNPSTFNQESFEISVHENALPGTILKYFLITDLDAEKSITSYYIMSGDKYSQFQIGKTGELFVAKPLDREAIPTYNLNVLVTDGKFVANTEVTITVQDVNDNVPICMTPRYNLRINESVMTGTPLIQIDALDNDENGNSQLRYYLTGNRSDDFFIEKDTGTLRVAKTIDRETHARYILTAHVQDGQELLQECTSELIINVNDLNDNRPEFSMAQYIVSIPEDAPIGTIVTKVHATDKDFGLNRKIVYSFVEEQPNFSISRSSGIIKLSKSLDRESISIFNVSIKAVDSGNPKQLTITRLIINVLDINDNPPEFSTREYKTYVYENATVNTEVVRIFATSKDIGVNAEVLYFIMGGNEHNKFSIDSKTGSIYVNDDLDYERTKAYFLTVQAIDGGTPPLSNMASVNISVLDVNDNAPKFTQNMYRAKVREDAPKMQKLLQVLATDADAGQNGIIRYNIERGDHLNQFAIEDFSGQLIVVNALDRELNANYLLEIKACDNGVPEQCSYVRIYVDILDVNDNPPLFRMQNYSVVLQENKQLGYNVLLFEISDADEAPNTAPYTFDLRSGNEGGFFRIGQDGWLRTAARFNHKICDIYTLQVRVFDNGTPPLYSDAWVHVRIIEESQYPPVITPLEVTVKSYDDDYMGGFLGRVHASDQDKYDNLLFALTPTSGEVYVTKQLFNISQNNGSLYAISNLDIGMYRINITVTDGKFTAHALVKLNVELITGDMTRNAIVISFRKVTPEAFILSHRKGFIRALRAILRCRQKDITIIAIQASNSHTAHKEPQDSDSVMLERSKRQQPTPADNLNVLFAVRKQQITPSSEEYFTTAEVRAVLVNFIDDIEDATNLVVEEIMSPTCTHNICVQGDCFNRIRLNKRQLNTYSTDVASFASPTYKHANECQCKQGYGGRICNEPINACSSNPCPPEKTCWPANTTIGYQCICPQGFTGHACDSKSTLTKCQHGNCSARFTSVSFSGKSYAHYKINKAVAKTILEQEFVYSLKIRTVQQTGTLLFSSGRIDYHILEIYNGAVQYRYELGSGEGKICVSSIYIADGEWHTITLERILNSAKLTVDNKHVSQGSAPGVNGILNIQSNDIFVGAEVKPHPAIIGFEDIQKGFIGCMSDIKIALEPLPLYISGGSSVAALKRFTNVEFTCDPTSVLVQLGICGAQPCLNGGICIDLGENKFKCTCHARFTGQMCEVDMDPCASAPCLFGGRCEVHEYGNYSCVCPLHLSGRRCEYGKYCSPNPCKNGGVCEEGDGTPHCMCRGYTGPTCEIDVNECDNHPCGNGATCINEAGSFRCICPSYLTGASCGDPLYSNSISTKLRNLSMEQLAGIVGGIVFIIIVILVAFCCIVFRKSSNTSGQNSSNKDPYKGENLNSLVCKEKYAKNIAKMSNLEINQRPMSYTASTNDNLYSGHTTFVNNLDILRSYGSAGDELENIPFEYQKINRNNEHVNLNDSDPIQKRDWAEQMHLKTFSENKLNNEKLDYTALKSGCSKMMQVTVPNVCHSPYTDYPPVNHGQYHWDCSDWVRKSHNPLPDITEVPGAEIADSSSFHSNDSNESKPRRTYAGQNMCIGVDPTRDIVTLNEDLTSECIDSELESCMRPFELPLINHDDVSRLSPQINFENEDFITNPVPSTYDPMNSCNAYLRHPDSYLPPFNVPSETEGESSSTEVFSKATSEMLPRRKLSDKSEEIYVFRNLHSKNGSNSDLSVHLCEIEDSELEEFLPSSSKDVNNR
uniref:Fat-like cadherin-related tumor suppressor homolog n=1 Tax=Zeugodacus cucurbitae TaxID=28588 RepID=A0A0A1WPP1_ZEUCU